MKKLFTIFLICFATYSVNAQQIKLTQDDFPDTSFSPTFYLMFGLSNQVKDSLDIGVGDTGELYKFNKLKDVQANTSQTLKYKLASQTPHAAQHSTATLAYISNYVEVGSDTTFIRWKFIRVDEESAAVVGSTFEIDTASYINGNSPASRNVIKHTTYDNPETLLDTNFQKGYIKNDTSTLWFTIDDLTHYETVMRSYWVDGYGELDHPLLDYTNLDVLRTKVRLEVHIRDTINGVEDFNMRDTGYFIQYITKTFGVCVNIRTNATYTSIDHVSFLALSEVIPSARPVPTIKFNMYPNPANDITRIDFDNPLSTEQKLTVYNMLGQEMLTQNINAGSTSVKVDVSTLQKGTYIIILDGEDGAQTLPKKLMVN